MQSSPCLREACFHACCLTPLRSPNPPDPMPKSSGFNAARVDFAATTASSLFPNTQFTNHESLPSLTESFSHFTKAYPLYSQTEQTDQIRSKEYYHLSLSNHVCLDYVGLGLFSNLQQQEEFSLVASSSSFLPPRNLEFPAFDIRYKSVSLSSEVLYGGQESELESGMKKRIMDFLHISPTDYAMVFTVNRTSAFKLLSESYPFQSNKKLLTVYDYKSEAVEAMINNSQKRGAKIKSAEFSWPGMRIQSKKLRNMVTSKRKKGLFVFPVLSKITGTRYSYRWMTLAQENGWHVALDICALGPKEMDTLGLSLFRPDFLICSFYKVFGEDPSGFGCLFVKRSSASILEASTTARSIGIVSLVPANISSQLSDDFSGTDMEMKQITKLSSREDLVVRSSFSGPVPAQIEELEYSETSEMQKESLSSDIEDLEEVMDSPELENSETSTIESDSSLKVACRGLDDADSLGLIVISNRARCLINWFVRGLMKLQHPHSENGLPLVKIYGPKIKFDRGPAVAFNVFDWKGEKVEPVLVQKLADRNNISLSCGFLHNIWFSDIYEEEKEIVLETKSYGMAKTVRNKRKEVELGITVVTASLGFLANFEDVYRLWAFVAQFLDADFVEKARWRYMALNQKIVEV
ncbi:hypothetical protein GIB67_026151 [Kingdonia uniflora]|uniref:Molybdenum cofactor sulfurase n=1 Tax=Kingdonia uniflora TaxID=39325 RepID=A0A7J7M338_9MAGN|nr:hypothetical protein GIB67_026151 [Kingdonia uniflora]